MKSECDEGVLKMYQAKFGVISFGDGVGSSKNSPVRAEVV